MESQNARDSRRIHQSDQPSDDLDDLFNYDVGIDDIFMQSQSKQHSNPPSLSRQNGTENARLGLGLDEEVKIVRKRQSIAKLDDSR